MTPAARRIVGAIVAIVAGPALARPPQAAIPAGPAETCIPLNQIQSSDVKDDRTIDFRMSGRKIYRNVLPQPCPQLGFERRFAYDTSLSRLCNTDIITVLLQSPPIRGASCGLGDFQPMSIPKK